MQSIKIVKIGGNVIDHAAVLDQTLHRFVEISGPKLLVHGGGKLASHLAEKLGIVPVMVAGRRVTDAKSLEVVQMVYAGLINKNIVASLSARNCPAVGLSGADADTILAIKRPVETIDFGFVGDITCVNISGLRILIDAGFTPVFCALTHDGNGQMLNTNADTIATRLAIAFASEAQVDLLYCFEKPGVMLNLSEKDSALTTLSADTYVQMKTSGQINGGMIPKIDNAFAALNSGVHSVRIGNYKAINTGMNANDTNATLIIRK